MREMKDSGVEWIGEIPREWEVCRFKDVCSLFTGNSIKDEEKSLYEDITNARPYIATKDIDATFCKADYKNGLYIKNDDKSFKVAPKDSTLMCIEGGSAGRKKAKINQEVSFVNKLCCFYSVTQDNSFISHFLNSPSYENEFKNNISGLIGGVSVSTLKNIPLVLPPLETQHRIADYLDRKCSKIDEIIEKEGQVIEKLKAYKLSVITEAVTKGLDPNVAMKDSGVEWIGEIPEGWIISKIRYTVEKIGDIDHYMPNSVSDGKPYVMTGDLLENAKSIIFTSCKQISNEDFLVLSKKIKPSIDDVIFARYATIGTICYVDIEEDFLVSYSCVTIRTKKAKMIGKYLFYYLKSNSFFEEVGRFVNSNTQGNVGIDSLYKVRTTLPPLSEQQAIADYLDRKCTQIDSTITKKQSLIDKLTSYKKSLIYEVVTGKKEV